MEQLIKPTDCKTCHKKSLLFESLNDKELELANKNKKEIIYKKKEVVCKEGEEIKELIYLKKGLIKLYKKGINNKDQILTIAKPLDFIGLLSIFLDTTYKYSISTLEDSTICLIKINFIKELVKNNGFFALNLLKNMSKTYDDIIKTTFDINTKQLRGRIAYIILYFSQYIYNSNYFILPITRRELGELIDMSTGNIIRILSEFKKDKILRVNEKKIEILNIELLKKISELG